MQGSGYLLHEIRGGGGFASIAPSNSEECRGALGNLRFPTFAESGRRFFMSRYVRLFKAGRAPLLLVVGIPHKVPRPAINLIKSEGVPRRTRWERTGPNASGVTLSKEREHHGKRHVLSGVGSATLEEILRRRSAQEDVFSRILVAYCGVDVTFLFFEAALPPQNSPTAGPIFKLYGDWGVSSSDHSPSILITSARGNYYESCSAGSYFGSSAGGAVRPARGPYLWADGVLHPAADRRVGTYGEGTSGRTVGSDALGRRGRLCRRVSSRISGGTGLRRWGGGPL